MERIDYRKLAPEGYGILGKLSAYTRDCGLDAVLI